MTLLAFTACQKSPPAKVEIQLPDKLTSKEPVPITVRLSGEHGGSEVTREPQNYTIEPDSVASVSEAGQLSCKKSGDAKLSVDVRGVGASADVRCRIISAITIEDPGPIPLDDGPVQLVVSVKNEAGAVLDDVSFDVSAKNKGPAKIQGLTLTPQAVGETELVAKAGSAKATVKVQITKKITNGLSLNKGQRVSYLLDPGTYRLTVTLPEERDFEIKWSGAGTCNQKKKAKEHESVCTMSNKGNLILDHPTPGDDSGIDSIVVMQIP